MMNKVNIRKGFMAAVLVGMTLSCAPVQAGVGATVWGGTKKVLKVVVKGTRICVKVGLVVGGAVAVGAALDPANTEKFMGYSEASFRGAAVGLGGSAAVLAAYFLYQEFKSNKKDKD